MARRALTTSGMFAGAVLAVLALAAGISPSLASPILRPIVMSAIRHGLGFRGAKFGIMRDRIYLYAHADQAFYALEHAPVFGSAERQ